jgi:hypothetical protein
MDFALNPSNGPPRLIRFVSSTELPDDSCVSYLIVRDNLLLVNRHHYEQLTSTNQQRVIKTHSTTLTLGDFTYETERL